MRNIQITSAQFPDIKLEMRDGHKLRGCFAGMFKEHSILFHNHHEDGSVRQAYSLIQYKVLNGVPTVIGLDEGGQLLQKVLSQVKHLKIGERLLPVNNCLSSVRSISVGTSERVYHYRFDTVWMALNCNNVNEYHNEKLADQKLRLSRILTGNILMFLREVGEEAEHTIRVVPNLTVRKTLFKGLNMLAFKGGFSTNVLLPDGIGLGKSVARGFGAISQIPTGSALSPQSLKRLTQGGIRPRYKSERPVFRARTYSLNE